MAKPVPAKGGAGTTSSEQNISSRTSAARRKFTGSEAELHSLRSSEDKAAVYHPGRIHPFIPIGRYQFKIVLSYLAVMAAVLILLNTYPVWLSQSIMFQNKQSSLNTQATLMTSGLSTLEQLTVEAVEKMMARVDEVRNYRVVICDEMGLILYDNSTRENAAGRYAVYPQLAQALAGSDVFSSDFAAGGFSSSYSMPIVNKGRHIGALYLYDYDSDQAALLTDLQMQLSGFSIVITLVLLVVSLLISAALTHRFTGLLRAIHSLREGNFSHKAPVQGKDELAEVAGQFNDLAERLQKTESLRQQFVSDASHELKTPLASIRLLTDSILQTEDMEQATLHEFMGDIGDEIDRLTRLTEKLIQLTRLESNPLTEPVLIPVASVVRRAAHMLEPFAQQKGVMLKLELEDSSEILGDVDDLYLILYNLMENAVKYNKKDGAVRVFCYPKDIEVIVIVDDTGIGIPEEDIPRIFERFYRVDKTRSRAAGGTGLGLAVVHQTLERLHGYVKVESLPERGTRFTLAFPTTRQGRDRL